MPEERRQVESSEEGSLSRCVAGSAGWSEAEEDGEVERRFGERVGIGTLCCWGRWANAAAAGAVPPRELEYRWGEVEDVVVGGVGVEPGTGKSPGISLGMWWVFVAAVLPERVFR